MPLNRRNADRYRCQLPCVLVRGGRTVPGTVIDVSLSGLSVTTRLALEQGDSVRIEIPEIGMHLTALAWHRRRVASRGEAWIVYGMMISKAGRDYEEMLTRMGGARPSRAPAPPAGATARLRARLDEAVSTKRSPTQERAATRPPPAPPLRGGTRWFRVRVKERASRRARVFSLAAASAEEARTRALAEIGDAWEVLDLKPA